LPAKWLPNTPIVRTLAALTAGKPSMASYKQSEEERRKIEIHIKLYGVIWIPPVGSIDLNKLCEKREREKQK